MPDRNQAQQAALRVVQNGTHCTQDALSHMHEGAGRSCRFCGADDSVKHRFLNCHAFLDMRSRWRRKPSFSMGGPLDQQGGLSSNGRWRAFLPSNWWMSSLTCSRCCSCKSPDQRPQVPTFGCISTFPVVHAVGIAGNGDRFPDHACAPTCICKRAFNVELPR